MKNVISLFVAGLLVTASVNAQSTVDSISAKYKLQPMPEALTIEKTFPVLGTYQLSTTDAAAAQNVTVSLDQDNKGMIWIEGLPEGKMKAYLKKTPGTYRIVSQKSENGKDIPEGTLVFDQSTNTLNIALGKAYDEVDPASVFNLGAAAAEATADAAASGSQVKVKTKTATSKTKTKLVFYTATKAETSTSTSTNSAKQ
jgi:hypothetical protein